LWSVLARAQLSKKMVKESIDSFIKADDASDCTEVIKVTKSSGKLHMR